MFLPLLFISALYGFAFCNGNNNMCQLCEQQVQPNTTIKALKEFCTNGKTLDKRCCYNDANKTIVVGVDWSGCKLKQLPVIPEKEKYGLEWVAVANNNISIKHSELRFFRNLSTLIIPSHLYCNTSFTNHIAISNDTQKWTNQVNVCGKTKCPTHSHCVPDGPGLNMCLCDKGWNSYRCLKKEGFPAVRWIAGFSATTIVICLSLKIAQRKSLANAGANAS